MIDQKKDIIIYALPNNQAGWVAGLALATLARENNLTIIHGEGFYNGEYEKACIMTLPDGFTLPDEYKRVGMAAFDIVSAAGESSIMIADHKRDTVIFYFESGLIEEHGKIISINEDEAQLMPHTKVNGLYFSTERAYDAYKALFNLGSISIDQRVINAAKATLSQWLDSMPHDPTDELWPQGASAQATQTHKAWQAPSKERTESDASKARHYPYK